MEYSCPPWNTTAGPARVACSAILDLITYRTADPRPQEDPRKVSITSANRSIQIYVQGLVHRGRMASRQWSTSVTDTATKHGYTSWSPRILTRRGQPVLRYIPPSLPDYATVSSDDGSRTTEKCSCQKRYRTGQQKRVGIGDTRYRTIAIRFQYPSGTGALCSV